LRIQIATKNQCFCDSVRADGIPDLPESAAGKSVERDLDGMLTSHSHLLTGEASLLFRGGVTDLTVISFTAVQAFAFWKLRTGGFFRYWRSKRMIKANKLLHSFVDGYVEKALGRVREEKEKDGNPESGRYIFLDAVARETRDPIFLRDQMLSLSHAGRDPTAALIGWTFYLLAWHPRVYKKLRDDLEAAFGTAEHVGIYSHY
jgi:hypothetical protein